jgi:hypothetical protein
MGPMLGANCYCSTTRFESAGAHRCEEQRHARDTRVYTGSVLHEDKDHTSCVYWCIIIRWVETPSTPHL